MEIKKLDVSEIIEAFKNKEKFKNIVLDALEYLINKKEDSNIYIIKVRDVSNVVKEMLNIKTSEFDRRIDVKVGLALKNFGIETFRAGVDNRKEFVISRTQFEFIKHAYKKQ
jgi:hypothetical protein